MKDRLSILLGVALIAALIFFEPLRASVMDLVRELCRIRGMRGGP